MTDTQPFPTCPECGRDPDDHYCLHDCETSVPFVTKQRVAACPNPTHLPMCPGDAASCRVSTPDWKTTRLIRDAEEFERLWIEAKDEVASLRDLLRTFVEHEDQPCSLDHHGYCQEHGWLDEGECNIARGRRMLGLSGGAA